MKPETKLVVFDVNETLLDLAALDPLFEKHFGDVSVRKEWFDQVLKSAFATAVLGTYRDFGEVARSALEMLAERYDTLLTEDAAQSISKQMRRLPPHPDVIEGVRLLKDAGFRLAALTNSPPDAAREQLENAGIASFLEAILSVDSSKSLKPARVVYDDAVGRLGAQADQTTLIAAHAWDIAGAMNAGWQGIFLKRKGKTWNPLFDSPTFMANNLQEAANWLIMPPSPPVRTADS